MTRVEGEDSYELLTDIRGAPGIVVGVDGVGKGSKGWLTGKLRNNISII